MRAAVEASGRDPQSLKFFPCFMLIIGSTVEDAKAKHERTLANADPVAGLAQFSGYTAMAIQAVLKALEASEGEEKQAWTPRRLGRRMALGGLHPCPVGTAQEVADVIQEWVEEADIDGGNIGSVTNPSSWEDVVDLLVLELQKRGLMWDDYAVPGGTFRENLLGIKTLSDDHYRSRFKWSEGMDEEKTP